VARIVLLGIGNVLMGDDAAGPTAVKLLEAGWEFSPEVEVIEGGTPGLDIASLVEGAEALLVVDAVRARGDPGEIRLLDEATLLGRAPGLSLSPHEPGLREALLTMELSGGRPRRVRLVGIVPERIDVPVGLSAPVRAALPRLLSRVLEELRALGGDFRPRARPLEPDLWWERPPAG
jgi:hydrogenase maturation protease